MYKVITIRQGITFTPASRKSSQKIQNILLDDAWVVIVNRSCNFAYLERFKGGDPDDYVSGTEELQGLYYSRAEAEEAKEKAIDSWRKWLLIENGAAGEVSICQYTGGYYSEYTDAHESVAGCYSTYPEAQKALQAVRQAMHCWLVIDDHTAGFAYLCEYTGGAYSEYTGAHGDIVLKTKDLHEAQEKYDQLQSYYKKLAS